ncbi:hypothetical protein KC322_g63 [Hortaea werneckii]|nr:hypothetical protein KC322_g63 [Hortaea werneckii]
MSKVDECNDRMEKEAKSKRTAGAERSWKTLIWEETGSAASSLSASIMLIFNDGAVRLARDQFLRQGLDTISIASATVMITAWFAHALRTALAMYDPTPPHAAIIGSLATTFVLVDSPWVMSAIIAKPATVTAELMQPAISRSTANATKDFANPIDKQHKHIPLSPRSAVCLLPKRSAIEPQKTPAVQPRK